MPIDGAAEASRLAASLDTVAGQLAAPSADPDIVAAIASAASPRTPVRTGALVASALFGQDSITYRADYAGFVYFGTRFMAARPWITDASDTIQPQLIELKAAAIRAVLDTVHT